VLLPQAIDNLAELYRAKTVIESRRARGQESDCLHFAASETGDRVNGRRVWMACLLVVECEELFFIAHPSFLRPFDGIQLPIGCAFQALSLRLFQKPADATLWPAATTRAQRGLPAARDHRSLIHTV
jgi:hypothetical protein